MVQAYPGDAGDELPGLLREALAEGLARFKIPTAFHITGDDLPRTATGKVLKRELKSLFPS